MGSRYHVLQLKGIGHIKLEAIKFATRAKADSKKCELHMFSQPLEKREGRTPLQLD